MIQAKSMMMTANVTRWCCQRLCPRVKVEICALLNTIVMMSPRLLGQDVKRPQCTLYCDPPCAKRSGNRREGCVVCGVCDCRMLCGLRSLTNLDNAKLHARGSHKKLVASHICLTEHSTTLCLLLLRSTRLSNRS